MRSIGKNEGRSSQTPAKVIVIKYSLDCCQMILIITYLPNRQTCTFVRRGDKVWTEKSKHSRFRLMIAAITVLCTNDRIWVPNLL